MAVTITKEPNILTPAYSPMDYIVTSDTAIVKYEIKIHLNLDIYTIELLPTYGNTVEFDISAEVQAVLESKIYNYDEQYGTGNLVKGYTEDIVNVYIIARGYSDATTYLETTSSTVYAFNGVLQAGEDFDFNRDYQMYANAQGKFLNNFKSKKCEVDREHPITLQFFEGVFGIYTSKINNMYFRYLDFNFNLVSTISATTYPELLDLDYSSAPKIKSVQIPEPQSSSIKYIEVISDDSETVLIELAEPNTRFQTYQIAWTNHLGGTDYYFFRGNSENVIEVEKEEYKSIVGYYNQAKNYNIEVEDRVTCYSDYLCSDVAKGLKSLWYSPKVVSVENGIQRPIIIDVDTIKIYNRVPSETPIYRLEFKYANEFKIQQR